MFQPVVVESNEHQLWLLPNWLLVYAPMRKLKRATTQVGGLKSRRTIGKRIGLGATGTDSLGLTGLPDLAHSPDCDRAFAR